MSHLPAIFSLIVAAAGWFYIFYSRAATNLSGLEECNTNRLRVRLRRVGGLVMILLAVAFYLGFIAIERHRGGAAASLMLAVLVLLLVTVVLALIDVRLTRKLRRLTRQEDPP